MLGERVRSCPFWEVLGLKQQLQKRGKGGRKRAEAPQAPGLRDRKGPASRGGVVGEDAGWGDFTGRVSKTGTQRERRKAVGQENGEAGKLQ